MTLSHLCGKLPSTWERCAIIGAAPAGVRKAGLPKEFMFGRPLGPEELEIIRSQIEAMDDITAIDDELRGLVERNRPHLRSKLPPEDPPLQ
jgi:hypothetical protein